jgi:hypothetical protein
MNQSHLPSVDEPFINQRHHHHQPEVPHNHRPWEKCRSHNARRIVSKLKEQVKETKRKAGGGGKKKADRESHTLPDCRSKQGARTRCKLREKSFRSAFANKNFDKISRSRRQCLLHTHAPSLVPQTLISSHPITALQRSNSVKNNLANLKHLENFGKFWFLV